MMVGVKWNVVKASYLLYDVLLNIRNDDVVSWWLWWLWGKRKPAVDFQLVVVNPTIGVSTPLWPPLLFELIDNLSKTPYEANIIQNHRIREREKERNLVSKDNILITYIHQFKLIVLTWLKSFVVIALGKRRYQVVYNITRQLGDKVDVDVFYLSLVHKHSAILLVDMQWQGLYTLYTIFSCCHVILRRFIHTTHSHKNRYFLPQWVAHFLSEKIMDLATKMAMWES